MIWSWIFTPVDLNLWLVLWHNALEDWTLWTWTVQQFLHFGRFRLNSFELEACTLSWKVFLQLSGYIAQGTTKWSPYIGIDWIPCCNGCPTSQIRPLSPDLMWEQAVPVSELGGTANFDTAGAVRWQPRELDHTLGEVSIVYFCTCFECPVSMLMPIPFLWMSVDCDVWTRCLSIIGTLQMSCGIKLWYILLWWYLLYQQKILWVMEECMELQEPFEFQWTYPNNGFKWYETMCVFEHWCFLLYYYRPKMVRMLAVDSLELELKHGAESDCTWVQWPSASANWKLKHVMGDHRSQSYTGV